MAIIVTVEGKPAQRYVICPEDENLFAGLVGKPVPVAEGTPSLDGTRPPSVSDVRFAREDHLGRFSFCCQRLRSGNRVDGCFTDTLSTWEIVKVAKGTVTDYYGTR